MGQALRLGNPPIEITLRRSARARRLSLRVSRLDGRVTLSLPAHLPERAAVDFLREREGWLRGALADVPSEIAVAPGIALPIEGREVAVSPGKGRAARLTNGTLHVPEGRPGPAAAAFLKHLARDRLSAASDRYAGLLGREVTRLTLRDTRSRWGSCTSAGALMYSWRLAMAPPEVLDYVAAHEVAHLVHMDHSPAFWAVVDNLCPAFRTHRAWLRREGTALHRYRFTD